MRRQSIPVDSPESLTGAMQPAETVAAIPAEFAERVMSFHVGQRVVCVDTSAGRYPCDLPPLEKGSIYTIRDVTPCFGELAVQIEERYRRDYWFRASRFRPLDERRLDIFRAMLVTPPKETVAA